MPVVGRLRYLEALPRDVSSLAARPGGGAGRLGPTCRAERNTQGATRRMRGASLAQPIAGSAIASSAASGAPRPARQRVGSIPVVLDHFLDHFIAGPDVRPAGRQV